MDASKYQMLKSWLDSHLHSTNHDHLAGDPDLWWKLENPSGCSKIAWSNDPSQKFTWFTRFPGKLKHRYKRNINNYSKWSMSNVDSLILCRVSLHHHVPCLLNSQPYPLHGDCRDSTHRSPKGAFPIWSCLRFEVAFDGMLVQRSK